MHDHFRFHLEQPLIVRHRLLEGAQGDLVFQVADMVADEGKPIAPQTERVFQLAPTSQHVPPEFPFQPYRRGRISPCASQQARRAVPYSSHRIVTAGVNFPVVREKSIGDPAQPFPGIFILVGDGLIGEISAGHHQGPCQFPQQQVMERGIGEHHPQFPGTWSHQRSDGGRRLLFQQHDGAGGRRQQPRFLGIHDTDAVDVRHAGSHQGKRLVVAAFPRTQPAHRLWAGCVTGEMEPAQPLDGQHLACQKAIHRARQRILGQKSAGRIGQVKGGAAPGASDRFRMKAPVCRVFILPRAVRAQREGAHGCMDPVIGEILDQCEPWSAVGAVGEGVAISALAGCAHFQRAIRAGPNIRGNQRETPLPDGTALDPKA